MKTVILLTRPGGIRKPEIWATLVRCAKSINVPYKTISNNLKDGVWENNDYRVERLQIIR